MYPLGPYRFGNVASQPAVASNPPLPAFSGTAWGLNNWNPVGYPSGQALNASGDNEADSAFFTAVAPYPIDYLTPVPQWGNPPYIVGSWQDQNSDINPLTASGSARPTLSTATKTVDFDGAANGMAGAASLIVESTTATVYVLFKAGSLAETSVLLETSDGGVNRQGRISIRMVAGVLTCAAYDDTAVVNLPNTKIKTISDFNWHLLAFTVDSTQGTAVNQTALKVDNSATGVTSPASADLHGLNNIGEGVPNLGARNNAASTFFTGSLRLVYCKSTVENATQQTAFWTYVQYLQSLMP